VAADLDQLVAGMKPLVLQLVERCQSRGVEMRPNNGLRDPFAQARLWRQSRATEEMSAMNARFGG